MFPPETSTANLKLLTRALSSDPKTILYYIYMQRERERERGREGGREGRERERPRSENIEATAIYSRKEELKVI